MKKIRNPFVPLRDYNCFGCSPNNPAGLHMTFYEDGDEIISTWEPQKNFQGFRDVLHGGIQAALMDEIASWVVYVRLKTAGFTSKAEVRYLRTVLLNREGNLNLRARCEGMRRNLADVKVSLFDQEGILCTEGMFTYFTYSAEKARGTLYYPDHKEFYEPEAPPASEIL
jgi:acyl-coenzyme A thioesterase PaaI-like protein